MRWQAVRPAMKVLRRPARAALLGLSLTSLAALGSPKIVWEQSLFRDVGGCPEAGIIEGYDIEVYYTNPIPASLFFVKEKVCAHTNGQVAGIVHRSSRDLVSKTDPTSWGGGATIVGARRVRVIFIENKSWRKVKLMLAALDAVCSDDTARTVLVVSGDEQCKRLQPRAMLPASCARVPLFRHYFYDAPEEDGDGTAPPPTHIPLGPRNSFPVVAPGTSAPAPQREYLFNLVVGVGTSDSRMDLLRLAEAASAKYPSSMVRGVRGKKDALSPTAWRDLLLASRFTVCPGGHNPETFRLYEALEAGSIPIIAQVDFLEGPVGESARKYRCRGVWGLVADAPFARQVSVASWEYLPSMLDRLAALSDEELSRLQEESAAWYRSRMSRAYAGMLGADEEQFLFGSGAAGGGGL